MKPFFIFPRTKKTLSIYIKNNFFHKDRILDILKKKYFRIFWSISSLFLTISTDLGTCAKTFLKIWVAVLGRNCTFD